MEQGMADPQTDQALRIEFKHLVTKHKCNKMDWVELEKNFKWNQCQKV